MAEPKDIISPARITPPGSAEQCAGSFTVGSFAAGSIAIVVLALLGFALAAPAKTAAADADPNAAPEMEPEQIHEFLTPDEAIEEIFDGVSSVDTTQTTLTVLEIDQIRDELGQFSADSSLVVLTPRDAQGRSLGYAVIANEIGKYRPITFMVGTDPDLRIRGVEVLVYRESRGGEVRRQRFLRQYRGKTQENPIRLNRDILNIAGATLSVRALNHGIKRVLQSLALVVDRETVLQNNRMKP